MSREGWQLRQSWWTYLSLCPQVSSVWMSVCSCRSWWQVQMMEWWRCGVWLTSSWFTPCWDTKVKGHSENTGFMNWFMKIFIFFFFKSMSYRGCPARPGDWQLVLLSLIGCWWMSDEVEPHQWSTAALCPGGSACWLHPLSSVPPSVGSESADLCLHQDSGKTDIHLLVLLQYCNTVCATTTNNWTWRTPNLFFFWFQVKLWKLDGAQLFSQTNEEDSVTLGVLDDSVFSLTQSGLVRIWSLLKRTPTVETELRTSKRLSTVVNSALAPKRGKVIVVTKMGFLYQVLFTLIIRLNVRWIFCQYDQISMIFFIYIRSTDTT